MNGTITKELCEGTALRLIKALDAAIHTKTGAYHEHLRRFVRKERDPLTSTLLNACRMHGIVLVMAEHRNCVYVSRLALRTDEDVRKFCIMLNRRMHKEHPNDYTKELDILELSRTKLDQWMRREYNSPRFGKLLRFAARLHYRAWFYDLNSKTRIF